MRAPPDINLSYVDMKSISKLSFISGKLYVLFVSLDEIY